MQFAQSWQNLQFAAYVLHNQTCCFHLADSNDAKHKQQIEYLESQAATWLPTIDMPGDMTVVRCSTCCPAALANRSCLLILDSPDICCALRVLQGLAEQASSSQQYILLGRAADLHTHFTPESRPKQQQLFGNHGFELRAAYSTGKPQDFRYVVAARRENLQSGHFSSDLSYAASTKDLSTASQLHATPSAWLSADVSVCCRGRRGFVSRSVLACKSAAVDHDVSGSSADVSLFGRMPGGPYFVFCLKLSTDSKSRKRECIVVDKSLAVQCQKVQGVCCALFCIFKKTVMQYCTVVTV